MDDAWFHSFANTSNTQTGKERQRASHLLQQPTEQKADIAVATTHNIEQNPWRIGPPEPTLTRRAQSWADFYHVVQSFERDTRRNERRKSLQGHRAALGAYSAAEEQQKTLKELDEQLAEASHRKYQQHLAQIELTHSHLTGLLTSTAETLDLLSSLSHSFLAVASQTSTFRTQCENLLAEQKRLTELADAVEENANYYTFLESLTRRLNAPNAVSMVLSQDFPDILRTLDACIMYMEGHPNQRESAVYRSKYRLLLTRALTLIRHHFTKVLGEIANDISRRIQSGQLKDSTRSALLFAKFRVPAPELKSLGLEIQKRAVPTPEDVDANREPEYNSLLRELFQTYSTTRGRLVLPLVNRKMTELAAAQQGTGDVLSFAKAAISFMRGICLDEHDLWFEWFETPGDLYEFLESLMDPMYDYLRPLTIHETRLERLCDLCALVQSRYMDVGTDSDDEDDLEPNSRASVLGTMSDGRPVMLRRLNFAVLAQPALEDAQTRLVFLSLAVLRDGIENFRPKPADLKWPKETTATNGVKKGPILSGKRSSQTSNTPSTKAASVADDPQDILANGHGANSRREWYPTLNKAIWLLQRIYRLVNSTVFDDLAHRIVHSTTTSLISASKTIASKAGDPVNGQLFQITHLLHLKQSIVAFDIEFIPPEIDFDFSAVTNTFWELRERGNLLNPGSWYRLVSGALGGGLLPKVVENMLDAKAELDVSLRSVINDYVNAHAKHILLPIAAESIAAETKGKPADQPFDAVKAVRTVRGLAEKHVPLLRAKLEEWVHDRRVRETLVQAVRDQVVFGYEDFFDSHNEANNKKPSRKGKAREDEVLAPDVFSDAMEKVFAVSLSIIEEEDEE